MSGGGIAPGGYPMSAMGAYGKPPGELSVEVETTIDLHHDQV
jgi:hypothetical protein